MKSKKAEKGRSKNGLLRNKDLRDPVVVADWSVEASNSNINGGSVGRKSKGSILGSQNKKLDDLSYNDFMHDMREYKKEPVKP